MPSDIPAVALQAAPIYRLEVGMAVFAGFYIVALAIAFQGRWRQRRTP